MLYLRAYLRYNAFGIYQLILGNSMGTCFVSTSTCDWVLESGNGITGF